MIYHTTINSGKFKNNFIFFTFMFNFHYTGTYVTYVIEQKWFGPREIMIVSFPRTGAILNQEQVFLGELTRAVGSTLTSKRDRILANCQKLLKLNDSNMEVLYVIPTV